MLNSQWSSIICLDSDKPSVLRGHGDPECPATTAEGLTEPTRDNLAADSVIRRVESVVEPTRSPTGVVQRYNLRDEERRDGLFREDRASEFA